MILAIIITVVVLLFILLLWFLISFLKQIRPELIHIDFTWFLARNYYLFRFIRICLYDLIMFALVFKWSFNDFAIITITTMSKILLLCIFGIITIKRFLDFSLDTYAKTKNIIYKSTASNLPRASCASGAPGCGKTSSKFYLAVILAKVQWQKLKIKYFFYSFKDKSKLSGDNLDKYNEVMFAYKYYISHSNKFPCLWTSVPCRVGKRYSYCLTKRHLLQQEKIPYLSVCFMDEIGAYFPAKKGSNKELEPLSDFCRYIRHYIDGYFIFTEQEFSKAFVDVRRVTGSVQYFTQQHWFLKPKFLISFYNFILSFNLYNLTMSTIMKLDSKAYLKYDKASRKCSKRHYKFLTWLNRLINNIGWRKYVGTDSIGCEEANENIQKNKFSYYFESCLNCSYDDRAYKNKYKQIEGKMSDKEFTKLSLTTKEVNELFESDDTN